MRWLLGVLILFALVNIGLQVATWLDLTVINDNLFLVYGQCAPPGQDS